MATETETLESILQDVWETLDCAVQTAKHPLHSPVVSTVDEQGRPDSRVVILREADPVNRTLRFHTDLRAPKLIHLAQNPHVSFLFYSPADKLQLRIHAVATLHTDDKFKEQGWEESTLLARRCYSQTHGPGNESGEPTSGLPSHLQDRQPTEDEAENGRENFAVVRCQVTEIDWFSLAFTGHRRARFRWTDGSLESTWLVP